MSAAWRIVGENFAMMRDDAIARVGEMFAGVNNWFQSIGRSIENSVRASWRIVGTVFGQMRDDVAGIFRGMVAQIGGIWDGVGAVVRRPIAEMFGWINRNMIIPINNVLGKFSDSVKLNFLTPPGYADGGWIIGPGGPRDDVIPALVSNGEHITPAREAKANAPVLDAIRAGAVFELPPKVKGVAEQAAAAQRQGYGIGGIADVVTDVLARGAGAAVRFFADPALDLATRMFGGEWSPDVVLAGARNIVDNTARWGEAQDAIAAASGSTYTGPRGAIQRPLNSYAVTSEWMRSGSDPRHFGIDLGASMGTPVFAAANGRAIPTTGLGWNGGYGNMVTIDHGAGLKTLYAHMESLATSVGQLVSAGQRIGTVGSTGSSTGPHLHFETHRNGTPVNPRSVLTFDNGGYLPPGVSTVFNGTSGPEPILTDKQWKAVMDGGTLEAEVVVPLNIDGQQVAEALIRLKRNRGGVALGIA